MSDLKVSLTIPITLAQKAHCILCGYNPLMVEKQEGQPDRIRCIRCNLALELDTTKVYTRIIDLPNGLSVEFNTDWMRGADLRRYIRDLYNDVAGDGLPSQQMPRVSHPSSHAAPAVPASAQRTALPPVSSPNDDLQERYPWSQDPVVPSPVPLSSQTTMGPDLDSDGEVIPRWMEVSLPPTEQHGQWICPFLKLESNPTKGLAYLSPSNACYKIQVPQLVSLAHQEEICMSGRSATCPVMASGFEGLLPLEIRGKRQFWLKIRRGVSRVISVLAFCLLLAAAVYVIIISGAASVIASYLPFPGLPIQALLASSRAPTRLPTLFISQSPLIPTQVSANGQDVILGPEKQYTLHIILEGETLDSLAKTYHMTPEAIKKVNPLANYDLEPLTVLVMVSGHWDLNELNPLKAIQIDKETSLNDLLSDYQISEPIFQSLNQLTGNQILPGQWVILPYYAKFTILPTSTPTPMPSS